MEYLLVLYICEKKKNNTGVIWEQELYDGFEYMKDASFFHSFETDVSHPQKKDKLKSS